MFEHSYWFIYSRLMTQDFMLKFMLELNRVLVKLRVTQKYPTIFKIKNKLNNKQNQDIKFRIRHVNDFEYAQDLMNKYNALVHKNQKFFALNYTTKFQRFFQIFLEFNFKENGKSIHFTKHIVGVGHHEALNIKLEKVQSTMGYVSHFRTAFAYYSTVNIKSVRLDLHFFDYLLIS